MATRFNYRLRNFEPAEHVRAYRKAVIYRSKYRATARLARMRHYYKHHVKSRKWAKDSHARLRLIAIAAYGSHCRCCGERSPEFLAFDHVNNDGKTTRKAQGSGSNLYRWMKRNGYPNCFQILCHNCNMAKSIYGVCPHKTVCVEVS